MNVILSKSKRSISLVALLLMGYYPIGRFLQMLCSSVMVLHVRVT